MPVDPNSKIAAALNSLSGSKAHANPVYNKLSFLLLKDGTGYQAYIMAILADSAYVKGDMTKLTHNSYSKRDTDFSGMVLYFTPKGKYLNGYTYKNGHLQNGSSGQTSGSAKIQGVSTPKVNVVGDAPCLDWYWSTWVNGELISEVYLYTTCPDDGSGNGGGASGTPCSTPGSTAISPGGSAVINVVQPDDGGDDGSGDPGFPPPLTSVPCPAIELQNVKDSLTNPCFKYVKDLIASGTPASFGSIGQIINQSFGFSHTWNLVFKDANNVTVNSQPAEASTGANYHDPSHTQIDVNITLSISALQNASEQYIAATIIHEIMHAYFRLEQLPAGADHQRMAANYISSMSQALQDTFGMTAQDATALSWGGLNETVQGVPITAEWTAYKSAHPNDASQIQLINNQYKNAKKGYKCK